MSNSIEETRRKVSRQVLEQLEKADSTFAKQEMISKLIAKLPDEYVIALEFAYDMYKPTKESKQQ